MNSTSIWLITCYNFLFIIHYYIHCYYYCENYSLHIN